MNGFAKRVASVVMAVVLVMSGAALKRADAQPSRANLMPSRSDLPAKAPIKYRIQDEKPKPEKLAQNQEPAVETVQVMAQVQAAVPAKAGASHPVKDLPREPVMEATEEPVQKSGKADEEAVKSAEQTELEKLLNPVKSLKPENLLNPEALFAQENASEAENLPAPENPLEPEEQSEPETQPEKQPEPEPQPESTPEPEPQAPPEPEKPPKPEAMLGDDGMFYVSLYRLLEDMGYKYELSGSAKDRSLVVSWTDKAWGGYWVDMKTHYVHGPELLYQLAWIHMIEDEPYVPAQTVAEACFWTYSYDAGQKEATIERLALTRFKVDKTMQLMYTYGTDINGKEKLMRTSLTTTGSSFGSTPSKTYYPQPFRLNAQHKYYFPTVKVYIKYCSGLQGNICAHTTYTRSAYEINTSEMARGYAALGSRGSDGCVRFSFEDAKFLHCLGRGIPFTVVDGESTKAAQAEKDRLKRRQPVYGDWIRQMKLYE